MMEITLGSVIWLKCAVRRTATIGAAMGVVILMDSIDLSNTAMARCSKSGRMRTTSVRVQDILLGCDALLDADSALLGGM